MSNSKNLKRSNRRRRVKERLTTGDKARLLVFKSLSNNYAQLINDQEGKTIISASDLKITKGNKSERARAVGIELAKKALEKNITTCVFDRNGFKYHGRIKAIAEGAREGGLKF